MATYVDPIASAAETYEGLRGLAHPTRTFEDPADTYRVLAEVSGSVRLLRQVLGQLSRAHADHRDIAFTDDRVPAEAVALAAADELHHAADGPDKVGDWAMRAHEASGKIAELYNQCETAERRILSRVLSIRITIDAPAHVTAETKLPRHQAGQVSIFSSYVELTGFEPVTFCMPCRRATNCAIAPTFSGVAVATPAILHAHWTAAKSGGRFSDVSLTHPAPSRTRLTSTTARWQLPIPARP